LADVAFECRACQGKPKEPTVEEVVAQEQALGAWKSCLGNKPPPCFFLLDRNWTEKVHWHCAEGSSFVEAESANDAMKARACLLARMLIRQEACQSQN
jgi:hypothetical protein